MSTAHPIRVADTSATTKIDAITLEALIKRMVWTLGPTESLSDFDFSTGEVPLALCAASTGYVYFYDATDTTTADDGLTCLVSGDGRRYILADASAIAISSVLDLTNTPPVSPTVADAYVVGTSPTGAWVGHAKDIALYTKRGWVFAQPKPGCALLNEATGLNIQYSAAGAWGPMATSLDVDAVTPELTLMWGGLSVEAQQNAPPSLVTGLYYLVGTSPSGAWVGHSNDIAYTLDAVSWSFLDAYDGAIVFNKATDTSLTWFDATGDWRAPWPYQATCQGRLTLESGVAVSTTDQTAKATLYFTPTGGNNIALYISGGWAMRTFTEKSLSLSGYTAAKPYDIFGYDDSGVLALESLVWTDDTTRATALTLQDGIYVKSGDATRRYLGTIYTSATGQCEDSKAKRFVWNEYNPVWRPMIVKDTTNTWSYSTSTLRQARASSANQLDFVQGRDRTTVRADVMAHADLTGTNNPQAVAAIGLDSTSAKATDSLSNGNGQPISGASGGAAYCSANFEGYCGAGRHRLVWLEWASVTGGTVTWYGDNGGSITQSGIRGAVYG